MTFGAITIMLLDIDRHAIKPLAMGGVLVLYLLYRGIVKLVENSRDNKRDRDLNQNANVAQQVSSREKSQSEVSPYSQYASTSPIFQNNVNPVGVNIIIGRSPDNGYVVKDPKASRKHCRIYSDEQGNTLVEDMNSANGTWVNEKKIKTAFYLKKGDVLKIGDSFVDWERIK